MQARITLVVEDADETGAFQAIVDAGQWLQQGFTTVLAQGLDSGRLAARTFRVLVAPDRLVVAANSPEDSPLLDATPDASNGTVNLPLVVSGEGGWRGDYFDNPNLAGEPVLQRVDNSLSMNWGSDAPAPGLPVDGFSARWTTRAFPGPALRVRRLGRWRCASLRRWADRHRSLGG
ncbi:MAG: PA14 domain-containing protein [Caldilineales bacterium]